MRVANLNRNNLIQYKSKEVLLPSDLSSILYRDNLFLPLNLILLQTL